MARRPEAKRARAGWRASRGGMGRSAFAVGSLVVGAAALGGHVARIQLHAAGLLAQTIHVAHQRVFGLASTQALEQLGLLLLEVFSLRHLLALELEHGVAAKG